MPFMGPIQESSMRNTLFQDAIQNGRRLTAIVLPLLFLATGYATAADAQEEDFAAWLTDFRQAALSEGISSETLDAVLPGLTFRARVVELDRRQPEGTLTYAEYLSRVLPPARVNRGKRLLRKHRALLTETGDAYGVQPRFIVALWGIESDFGRVTGGFPVLDSLATLAFDGRRGEFFRGQLLEALRIVDDGHIQPDKMLGSWAGAMGQSQFMPSSFQQFAVDHDGDGRRDIWGTLPDVFASAANYLAKAGWKHDQTWGRQVRLPEGLDLDLKGLEVTKSLPEWQALGVRRSNGEDLPTRQLTASLILPGGPGGPAFLTYPNYRVLLKWNRSHYFATTVGQFANLLAAR
jgi:membrane-bound lytic murein transglycosylase B